MKQHITILDKFIIAVDILFIMVTIATWIKRAARR